MPHRVWQHWGMLSQSQVKQQIQDWNLTRFKTIFIAFMQECHKIWRLQFWTYRRCKMTFSHLSLYRIVTNSSEKGGRGAPVSPPGCGWEHASTQWSAVNWTKRRTDETNTSARFMPVKTGWSIYICKRSFLDFSQKKWQMMFHAVLLWFASGLVDTLLLENLLVKKKTNA